MTPCRRVRNDQLATLIWRPATRLSGLAFSAAGDGGVNPHNLARSPTG
jgi:hypothetical protein